MWQTETDSQIEANCLSSDTARPSTSEESRAERAPILPARPSGPEGALAEAAVASSLTSMTRSAAASLAVLTFCARALAADPPNTPQPMPPPPAHPNSPDAQDLPERFHDTVRFEADRARLARYFTGTVYTLTSLGIVGAGLVSIATTQANNPNAGALRAQGYVMMSAGGVAVAGSLVLTFMPSSAEQLEESYSAYADDLRIPAANRLHDGEETLRMLARREMFARHVAGAGRAYSIGIGLACLAVWRAALTESTASDRLVSGTLSAASSLVTIGVGISQLWFQRGSAEVTLAHWEASQQSLPRRLEWAPRQATRGPDFRRRRGRDRPRAVRRFCAPGAASPHQPQGDHDSRPSSPMAAMQRSSRPRSSTCSCFVNPCSICFSTALTSAWQAATTVFPSRVSEAIRMRPWVG